MKKALGWFGTLLGGVGIVLCLAGLIGVWVVHAKVQRPLNELAEGLAGLGQEVSAQANEVAGGIQTARGVVGELDHRVTQRAQELLKLTPEDLERVTAIQLQVRSIVQQLRAWADLARTAMDFVEQVVDMVESTVGFVQADPEARETLRTALAQGRSEIEVAAGLLDEVAAQLEGLRSVELAAEDSARMRRLSERIDAALAAVEGHITAFSSGIDALRSGILSVRDRIARVLRRTALVLTLLLVWQGAAQFSLAAHGWGFARGTTSGSGSEAPERR